MSTKRFAPAYPTDVCERTEAHRLRVGIGRPTVTPENGPG